MVEYKKIIIKRNYLLASNYRFVTYMHKGLQGYFILECALVQNLLLQYQSLAFFQ